MVKIDNVQRGADMIQGMWGQRRKQGKGGCHVPWAADLRVGIGVRYRHLEEIVGDIIGESNTLVRLASG